MDLKEIIKAGVFVKVKVNTLGKSPIKYGDVNAINKTGITVNFNGYNIFFHEEHGLDRGLRYMSELKLCEGNQSNSENANCAIFDVSNSLPDDVPLFIDWLDKYYTHAGNDDLYKRKDNGKIEPQRKLYNDYKRAYKLGNDC